MDEDNPPSYSEAMAAIAAGMRTQGLGEGRRSDSLPPDDMSSGFSDVYVIPPSPVDAYGEPPPPYDYEPPPLQQTTSGDSLSRTSIPDMPTSTAARINVGSNGLPAADGWQKSSEGGATLKPKLRQWNGSIPGPVIINQYEHIISDKSPATTEVTWSPPEALPVGTEIIYIVDVHAPLQLSGLHPTRGSWKKLTLHEWDELLNTVCPSVRVMRSPSKVMVGRATWAVTPEVLPFTLWLRVRAVEGILLFRNEKRGPWSKAIAVRFVKDDIPSKITEPQMRALEKHKEAMSLGSTDTQQHGLGAVSLNKLKYKIDSQSPLQTMLSWKRPSNAGRCSRLWYQVQVREHGKDPSGACADVPSWTDLVETQGSPLRIYKMDKQVSIGNRKWPFTEGSRDLILSLRVRAVGIGREGGCVEGMWSEEVIVHVEP